MKKVMIVDDNALAAEGIEKEYPMERARRPRYPSSSTTAVPPWKP